MRDKKQKRKNGYWDKVYLGTKSTWGQSVPGQSVLGIICTRGQSVPGQSVPGIICTRGQSVPGIICLGDKVSRNR